MIVYIAINKMKEKTAYIGCTVQSLGRRKSEHYRNMKSNRKGYFYNALRKYGKNAFIWNILQEDIKTRKELAEVESAYISIYKSKGYKLYNLTDGGYGITRYKHTKKWKDENSKRMKGHYVSEETKILISDNAKERYKDKENHPWYGRTLTREHRKKCSKARIGKYSGDNCQHSILKDNDILDIHMLYNTGLLTQKQISIMYNVSLCYIKKILQFKRRAEFFEIYNSYSRL